MQALETLLTAAIQAPSGDNTQPWRFAVDPDRRRIAIEIDPSRDPSPMNAGQRMARIAVGAALENIRRTLERNGRAWQHAIDAASGVVSLDYPHCEARLLRDEAIFARVTNRRVYDARPLDEELQTRLVLQTADAHPSVAIHWIFDRDRLPGLAELVARADAALFSIRAMRLALRANIRFEAGYREPVSEGLSLSSLELPWLAGPAFRFLTGLSDAWFRRLRGSGNFSRLARRLVNSASGLCVVTTAAGDAGTDVLVGQAVQKAWLALTECGLAAQPMMTLPVLENVLAQGTAQQQACLERGLVEELLRRFRELVPAAEAQRPAFVLRFGFAKPASGRTARLDWRRFCSWTTGKPQIEREPVPVQG